ncbi:MAG TPA: hypothetical protein ENN02_02525, partial [Halothiobacillus sp.]|nr:hypothetical protein [Halothiobacillus sp.]
MPCRPLLAVSAWFLSLVLTMPLPAADVSLIPSPQLGRGDWSGASLVLEPLDLTELSGSFVNSYVRASKAGGLAYWDGSRLILNTAGPTIDPVPEFIEHELPIHWRLRLNPDEQLHEIRLRAEWLAADGRSGGMMVDGQAVPGPPIQLRL